jgi:hypothetical protein
MQNETSETDITSGFLVPENPKIKLEIKRILSVTMNYQPKHCFSKN